MSAALFQIAYTSRKLMNPDHWKIQFAALDQMGFDPFETLPHAASALSLSVRVTAPLNFIQIVCAGSDDLAFIQFIFERYAQRISEHSFDISPLLLLLQREQFSMIDHLLPFFDPLQPCLHEELSWTFARPFKESSFFQTLFAKFITHPLHPDQFQSASTLLQQPLSDLSVRSQHEHLSIALLAFATMTPKALDRLHLDSKAVEEPLNRLKNHLDSLYDQDPSHHLRIPFYASYDLAASDLEHRVHPLFTDLGFIVPPASAGAQTFDSGMSLSNIYLAQLLLHFIPAESSMDVFAYTHNPHSLQSAFLADVYAPENLSRLNALGICAISCLLDPMDNNTEPLVFKSTCEQLFNQLQPHIKDLLVADLEHLNIQKIFKTQRFFNIFNEDKSSTSIFEALSFGFCHHHPLAQTLLPALLDCIVQPDFDVNRRTVILQQVQQGLIHAFEYLHPFDLNDSFWNQHVHTFSHHQKLYAHLGYDNSAAQNATQLEQQIYTLFNRFPTLCTTNFFDPLLERIFDAKDPPESPSYLSKTPLQDFHPLLAPVWIELLLRVQQRYLPQEYTLKAQIQDLFYNTCTSEPNHDPISSLIYLLDNNEPSNYDLLTQHYRTHARLCCLFESEDARSFQQQKRLQIAQRLSFSVSPNTAQRHLNILDAAYEQTFLEQQTGIQYTAAKQLGRVRL